MVVAPTGSGFRDDGVEKPKAAPSASPADQRKELLEKLMAQDSQEKLENLSDELVKELKKEGAEKEKIDLLASVLDKKQMEEIHKNVEALKIDPERIDDEKAEALRFLRATTPYLFSILAIRFDLKETKDLKSYVGLLPKVTDPEEKELLEGIQFLDSHPELETARYFENNMEPAIFADTKVLTQAARDAIDAVKGEGPMTWMKDQASKHPVLAGAALLLGTFAVFKAGQGIYHLATGTQPEVKPAEDKPGLLRSLTEGWSFLTKATISTLVFGGGMLVAGNILGREEVEKYLKEHHVGFLYENRVTASMILFCQGEFEEGLATWNFGPRDPEARTRHMAYAEQFGVTDKAVWLMASLNYKEFLNAEKTREFPLATGLFASIPVLRDWFKMPDQVSSENKMIDLIKVRDKEIHTLIPDADKMSLDAVLKKAFDLHIFKLSESAEAKTYSSDLKGFVEASEADSQEFAEDMKALGKKEKLSSGDLDSLRDSEKQVAQELDQLRLTVPDYWSDTVEAISMVFPSLAISMVFPSLAIDEGKTQDIDLIRGKQLYKAFSDAATKSDLDAIGVDVAELKVINDFTTQLEAGKPLTASEQALLTKYTDELAHIHDNFNQYIVRAKTAKRKELLEDAAHIDLKDVGDVAKLYWHGYKGLFYGLTWTVQKGFGENETPTDRVIGVAGTVGLISTSAGLPYGAYLIRKGEFLAGGLRMLFPPYAMLDARELYLAFFENPARLLELVIKGKITPEAAERICTSVLFHDKLIPERIWILGQKWAHSIDHFKVLKDCLHNRVKLEWLEGLLTGNIQFNRATMASMQEWQVKLINFIETKTGMRFEQFLEKMTRERGGARILLDALDRTPFGIKEKMVKFFETCAKKFGDLPLPKPVIEKLFSTGGAGLQWLKYFTENAAHLGFTGGMAYLATYYVCKDTYEGKDKSERIPLFVLGLMVSEGVFRGAKAAPEIASSVAKAAPEIASIVRNGGIFTEAEVGTMLSGAFRSAAGATETVAATRSAGQALAAGAEAAAVAPKHPLLMMTVALLAAFGISIAVEELTAPYLKNPTLFATSVRGLGAPILYTAGAGQLIDTVGHYYHATNTTEKEYFMRETYLPLLGSKKMAFRDGDVGYFNEMSPEDAVEVWNYQVREKMQALKKEDEAARVAGKPEKHRGEIAELDLKIIDRDWISRQIADVEAKKIEIKTRGQELFDDILSPPLGPSISPVEKRFVESILVTDVPETWFDESFYDIEKDQRFATVRKFAHALDKDDILDTWVERKRQLYSDIEFFKTIKVDDKVMHPKESERVIATLGIDPHVAEQAESLYHEVFGSGEAQFEDMGEDQKAAA